jgi:hypothetical protein
MCSPRVDLAALLWLLAVPALYERLGALSGPARPAAVTGEVAAVLLAAVIAWRQEGRRIEAERERPGGRTGTQRPGPGA